MDANERAFTDIAYAIVHGADLGRSRTADSNKLPAQSRKQSSKRWISITRFFWERPSRRTGARLA
jgi:hypothetical protein